jgi:hypothetical protein
MNTVSITLNGKTYSGMDTLTLAEMILGEMIGIKAA